MSAALPRLAIAGILAVVAATASWRAHPAIYQTPISDFSVLFAAASAWVSGSDPYAAVGPGRTLDIPHGVLYPFTAVLASVPFTLVPYPDQVYASTGAALLAWALTSRRRFRPAWFAVFTPAFIYTVRMSQWASYTTAAALLPTWGFLLACKPTVGSALWLAFPSRRGLMGAVGFAALSLVVLPSWPASWLAAISETRHIRAPITYWGGPLLFLAFLKWRRPEARLLGALACIPHTPELYESLPLFLVATTYREGALLAALNFGVVFARGSVPAATDYVSDMALTGQWMVWLLYLPCLVMVLKRPNDDSDWPLWRVLRKEQSVRFQLSGGSAT